MAIPGDGQTDFMMRRRGYGEAFYYWNMYCSVRDFDRRFPSGGLCSCQSAAAVANFTVRTGDNPD